MREGLRTNDRNNLRNKASDLKRNRPSTLPAKGNRQVKDVRKSTLEGLKKQGRQQARETGRQPASAARPSRRKPARAPDQQSRRQTGKPIVRPAKRNQRHGPTRAPRNLHRWATFTRGRDAKSHSNRGGQHGRRHESRRRRRLTEGQAAAGMAVAAAVAGWRRWRRRSAVDADRGGSAGYEHEDTYHRHSSARPRRRALLLGPPLAGAHCSRSGNRPRPVYWRRAGDFADPAAAIEPSRPSWRPTISTAWRSSLGLDPVALAKAENIKDTFEAIRQTGGEAFSVEEDGDQRIIVLGDEVWPFPFPLRKGKDGKWAFDTEAGIEEIINRRIGENELEAIKTVRAYVDAQKDYALEDRDGDGVLEFAQKLISSEGQTDGLYWPIEQGDGDKPGRRLCQRAAAAESKAKGDGYFGYRFRILRAQGNNIAGGRYDYVINGNMIAGFALIAWPVKYAETGVETFVVNQAGIVYEKDLGRIPRRSCAISFASTLTRAGK